MMLELSFPTRIAVNILIHCVSDTYTTPGVYKGEDHVWHRWPEVYLPNYGWIPADPSAEGHRPFPGGKARLIGSGSNRYLITTVGGGDSEYLDSYYNFNARWKTRGKCKIVNKAYGEYTPIIKTTEK